MGNSITATLYNTEFVFSENNKKAKSKRRTTIFFFGTIRSRTHKRGEERENNAKKKDISDAFA